MCVSTSGSYKPVQGLILVIVHSGYAGEEHGDTDKVSQGPIQRLINSNIAEKVFEHRAYGDSLTKHDGLIIDNEKCPGQYPSHQITGDEFIIVGGGLGYCHLSATTALIESRLKQKKSSKIHLPANSIYHNSVGYDTGDSFLESDIVSELNQDFSKYLRDILPLGIKYLIANNAIIPAPDRDVHLTIWSHSQEMLDAIVEREILKIGGHKHGRNI